MTVDKLMKMLKNMPKDATVKVVHDPDPLGHGHQELFGVSWQDEIEYNGPRVEKNVVLLRS